MFQEHLVFPRILKFSLANLLSVAHHCAPISQAFYSLLPGRFRLVYSMDSNTRALGLQRLFGALEELQATDRARRDSTDSTNSVDKGDSHTRKKHIEAAVTPAPPSVHGRVRCCLALFSGSSRSGRRW